MRPSDLAGDVHESRVFIDTRSPEAFAAGHIPGAVNVHEVFTYMGRSTPDGLVDLQQTFAKLFGAAGLSGEERAVVYEDAMDTGNGRSCRGYFLLRYLGYRKVSLLHGGYQAWTAAGLPFTTQVLRPHMTHFPLEPDESMMATKADVRLALSEPGVIKLDVRDEAEWLGQATSPSGLDPALRTGRIPGAIWLPWRHMLAGEPGQRLFRSSAEVGELCSSVGITSRTRVIVYCFKGSRASSTLVALGQAGITNIRNYFASWNEWGRDGDAPIASD
jgi:thiosulfate/3-mercaptopyruvate sulfurtransferase